MDAVDRQAAPDTLAAKVAAAQAELEASVNRAGLRDDPFRHPLQALSEVMGLFPDLVQAVESAVDRARQPIDPAALVRLEDAAARGADRRAAQLARSHNWRTLLIAAVVLVGTAAVAGGGGYWVGWHSQIVTESALSGAAFRDGSAAADLWLHLMQANDGSAVVKTCAATTTRPDGSHRACGLGLWLDPIVQPLPQTDAGQK